MVLEHRGTSKPGPSGSKSVIGSPRPKVDDLAGFVLRPAQALDVQGHHGNLQQAMIGRMIDFRTERAGVVRGCGDHDVACLELAAGRRDGHGPVCQVLDGDDAIGQDPARTRSQADPLSARGRRRRSISRPARSQQDQ